MLNVMLFMGPPDGFLLLSNSGSITHTSPTLHSHLMSLLLLYLESSPFQKIGEDNVNM